MKIKRFFESINYSTIKNYFSDLEDRYDDAILEITEINSNYFKVEVAPSEKIRKQISITTTEPLTIINRLKVVNKWQNECLEFIERAIVALNNSGDVENISFNEKFRVGFTIFINTTIEGETPEDWIKVDDDGDMEYDKILLKRIMKEKFDVDLFHIEIDNKESQGDFLILGFKKILKKENKESIEKYMMSLSATIYDQNRKIFNDTWSRDSRMTFNFNRLIRVN
jgi:hypothetical protein